MFACGSDSFCISIDWACDSIVDCTDESDERYCDCAVSEFNCFNGQCISEDLACDLQDDCGNNFDEFGCPGNKKTKKQNILKQQMLSTSSTDNSSKFDKKYFKKCNI